MSDEIFIECVKKYPCLWNTQLNTYKCNETKDAAWELVVKETSVQNVSTAKVKWKKLRDNHCDALKRQNDTRSGQAAKQIKPWKYQKIMEFLLPHMNNRNRTTNFQAEEIRRPDSDDTRMSAGSKTLINSDLENILSESANDDSQNSTTQNAPSSSQSSLASSTATNKRKADDITELLKKYQENHQQLMKERAEIREILTAPDSVDEIDHFFLGMAKSVKKLPAYLQRQVKRKTMNALMEAEEVNEQNLWIAPSYGYSTPTDPNKEPATPGNDNENDNSNINRNLGVSI